MTREIKETERNGLIDSERISSVFISAFFHRSMSFMPEVREHSLSKEAVG